MARRAKTRRLLNKDYRAEVKAVQKAAKKRGLFASVGGFLGGALATALTGGAAAPMVAAMMAGGGNYLGRKLGASLSKTDIKKAGGGKFAQSARNDIISQFKQQDIVSGLKGGLFAGIGQMGGLSKILGKGKGATGAGSAKVAGEGLKQGIFPKGTFSKMFKSSDPGALASQKGIGSLIDFRGSSIGQGLQKMKANSIAANAYMDNPDLLAGDLFEASGNVEELKRLTKLGKKAGFSTESIDFLSESYDPWEGVSNLSQPNIPIDPGYGDWGTLPNKELTEGLPSIQSFDIKRSPALGVIKPMDDISYASPAQIKGPGSIIPEPALGKGLSTGEQLAYDKINTMEDAGYSVSPSGVLSDEIGRGFIDKSTGEITMEPLKPNMPVDTGYGDFADIKESIINDPAMPNFNEASWAEGGQRIKDATKQAYWGSGTPAVEGLTEDLTGTGLSSKEELFAGQQDFTQGLGADLSKYDLLQETKSKKLGRSASRYQRLFGK